ncbi:MAG: XdhC family protein [Acidimicrobiales bacterium]
MADDAPIDQPVSLYDVLRTAINNEDPIALATVVAGAGVGNKILMRPDESALGSLGNDDLDRVVSRDLLGELAAGTSGIRHYGEHGEAREEAVSVFIETFAPPPTC